MGYNSVERLLIVSTKLKTLKQKIVSTEDAQPGQKFLAEIVSQKLNGLTVKVGEDLFGFITTMHVKDKPSKTWAKNLNNGNSLLYI